jgi:hypothetical protein
MELELTFGRVLRVWWAFLWRHLIATIFAVLVGGVLGAIIGGLIGVTGGNLEGAKLYLRLLGGLIGLVISFVPPWFVLNRNYGDFRLALISTRTGEVPPVLSEPAPDKAQEPTP